MDNSLFYSNLKSFNGSLTKLLNSTSNFSIVPDNWHIVVIDIASSTQAVKHKLHHPVNYAATHSIIAVLNELRSIDVAVKIPYFFGGDGATFLIPEIHVQRLLLILQSVKKHIYNKHFLELRVGNINITELKKLSNSDVFLSKFNLTNNLTVPVSFGNSLKIAEEFIKKKFDSSDASISQGMMLNFTGCRCSWNIMKPINHLEKIFCFIAIPLIEKNALITLKKISELLDQIFGDYLQRHPLDLESAENSLETLKLHKEWQKTTEESSILEESKLILGSLSKTLYDCTNGAKEFLKLLKNSSLALAIDGTYSDIIKGTKSNIELFLNEMEKLESKGELIFGYQITNQLVLSCNLKTTNKNRTQLMDAGEGGFSSAAKMLKIKAKVSN